MPDGATRQIVSLNAIVKAARDTLLPELENRSVVWRSVELGDVVCDPRLMQQVFVTLLSNALKSTQDCTPAVIHVGAFVLRGEQVVFVRDNRAGRKGQHDSDTAAEASTTAARIIRGQGGKTWSNPDVASGATVYFTVQPPMHGQRVLPHRPGGY